jgi:hypothetical protein
MMKKKTELKIVWFLRIAAWIMGLVAMGFLAYGILRNLNLL